MKLINRIVIALLSASVVLSGCKDEEFDIAKAVMASATSLTFDGQGAEEQIITVYSDKTWTADVPEWVTINPTSGSGTTDVAVSVSDNLRDGALDNPRKAELVFHGTSLASRSVVVVNQKGDKFRDVAEVTVSQAAELEDESVAIIKTSQVTALTSKGFIISDGANAVYVLSSEDARIGDHAEIWGTKESENGLPVISGCEKIILSNNSAVNYPDATDITASIDSYNATSREFVKATGTLTGNSVSIEGAETMRINILDAPASDEFEELNNHNVTVYGYFAGVSSPVVNIIVTGFDDLGVKSGLIFSDDFSWMAPYVAYYNSNSTKPLGRSVEDNNAGGNAPNAYTDPVIQASGLMEALAKKGYEDINAGKTSLYPQDCYWKFGKTHSHTGFRLPVIKYTGDAVLSFDWSPHMTGSGNIDKVNVVVEIVGSGKVVTAGGLASVSDPFENDWVKGHMGWKTSQVEIKGYSPTDRIIIRPEYLEDHDKVTQMRWYLDNIVMNTGDVQDVENVLFEDDFSWLQEYVDAAGEGKVGDTVGKNDKSAGAPNIYGTAEWQTKLLADLASRGYEDMCPDEKVVYLQPQYLKFGRTKGHNTSIRLPKLNLTGTADIVIECDWAAMAQGSGAIDDTKLVVVVEGDGQFGNGTKYSDLLENKQQENQIFWTHSSVRINGVSSNTRLVIVMYRVLMTDSAGNYTGEYNYNVGGAGRFFLDNIKISK